MKLVQSPVRVLELRSVLGTGGGPEKTILLGTARTDPTRYAVTVCYLRDARDPAFHVDDRARTLPVDYVEMAERGPLDLRAWRSLRALVRQRRFDIIHAHDYKCDLLALLLSKLEPVIALSTAHGWTGHSWKERLLYYPGDRRLLARFPRVIAVSSEIKERLVESGARPDRVTVVLNGIDHEAFRRDVTREAAARATFGFRPDDVVIGAIGRLEPQKNFALLLRAFARILAEYPRARLAVAGDGSLKDNLAALAADLRLGESCRFPGHVHDVALLHHALDVFVQSSDYEGTPNAVLEAMAFETPIVATDAGGTAELVRHGREGLIVRAGDEDGLVAGIREILGNRAAGRERAAAARSRVENELSFRARMRAVESIYDELMKSAAARRAAGSGSLADA